MATVVELRCSICERSYAPDSVTYTCPICGMVGTLDVLFDYPTLARDVSPAALAGSRDTSMWRYRALLPLQPASEVPPLRVGGTPLMEAPRLAADIGVRRAWVKDDGLNPTGSLKDRASSMVVARALEQNIPVVATASTGNAAAALAGVGASVGAGRVKVIIFVPASAPEGKIAQLLVYGATVVLVDGSYDTAFDLCWQMCQEQGWYCRNTGINPYTTEGKKTVSYEIAEGLGWRAPDALVVSVGDGNIIAGVHKGFYDLLQMGWIERIPKLIGVQATGSSPLVRAWQNGTCAQDMQAEDAHTLADSISAGQPSDRAKALRAVRATGGAFVAIDDTDILAAIPTFARLTGVFAEPSCAITYAGAKAAVESGYLKPEEEVVFLSTGSGLKDVRRAQQSVVLPTPVSPTLEAVRVALQIF
ncbi:MAG: threonine synthase [Chloroflexota bacterium]|nr:threonine synthase [Chloroflexota bacterium]